MVKVTYPNGKIVSFMWIDRKTGYGYNRIGKKILRYPLPVKS